MTAHFMIKSAVRKEIPCIAGPELGEIKPKQRAPIKAVTKECGQLLYIESKTMEVCKLHKSIIGIPRNIIEKKALRVAAIVAPELGIRKSLISDFLYAQRL